MPKLPETTASDKVATSQTDDKGQGDPGDLRPMPDAWEYEGAEDVDVPIPFRVTT